MVKHNPAAIELQDKLAEKRAELQETSADDLREREETEGSIERWRRNTRKGKKEKERVESLRGASEKGQRGDGQVARTWPQKRENILQQQILSIVSGDPVATKSERKCRETSGRKKEHTRTDGGKG